MSLITRSEKGQPLTASDHDANLRNLWTEPTVADLAASDASYSDFTTGDMIVVRDGGYTYQVVASDDDGYHVATAGTLRLKVLPDSAGYYNFKAFGANDNGTTDNYDVMMAAIYKTDHPRIYFPPADVAYQITKTVHIKRPVIFVSHATGSFNSPKAGLLRWPAGVRGLWIERGDTFNARPLYFAASTSAFEAANYSYTAGPGLTQIAVGARIHITGDNTAYEIVSGDEGDYDLEGVNGVRAVEIDVALLGPAGFVSGSGHGSYLEGMALSGTSPVHENKDAHGIHAQGRVNMTRCSVTNFSGDGVHIFAATDRKVNGPWETYGEASLCQIDTIQASRNGGCGFFIQGYDASAGSIKHIDAVGNGRWGVWEAGFLGNNHTDHHLAFNGVGRAAANTTGVQSALVTYGGQRFMAHPDATEQQLVDTTPGTDSSIWYPGGSGGTHPTDVPLWTSGQPVGTFFPGGAMFISGNNNRSTLMGVYVEGGQPPIWNMAQHVMVGPGVNSTVGGGKKWSTEGGAIRAPQITAESVINIDYEGEGEPETGNISTTLGGNDSNGDFMSFNGTHGDRSTGLHRLKARNGDFVFGYQNANDGEFIRLTGLETAQELGTGAPVPKAVMFRNFTVGWGSSARRQTNGTAAPTTGAWAQGDIVWNRGATAGGNVGWICVTAGEPGTWKEFGLIEE